ncbi:nuclear factor of activated T-cells 5 isoform X2 [Eurosta solidaginis]|uniref:nuclear factor of activated T-cells 5 isoform X2 n=1 Tax=Eurosta solidaginis TaxID=178769 RepID=UPI003530C9D1
MLLKCTKTSGSGAGGSSSSPIAANSRVTGMRMTMSTAATMTARIQRKGFRTPSKRYPGKAIPGKLHSVSRIGPGKLVPGKRFPQRPHPPPCDNSNDSGFGFDQHVEVQQPQLHAQHHHQQTASGSGASSSSSSSSNSSSGSSPGSSSSGIGDMHPTTLSQHHQHHNNGHGHHHGSSSTMQHCTQLIRAIPASRSTPNKKLPLNTPTDDDDYYDDFCTTDDSGDYYRQRVNSDSNSQSHLGGGTLPQASQQPQPFGDDDYPSTKRRKLESSVELDNDDACSEDAFIRKIASASNMEGPTIETSPPPSLMSITHAVAPTKLIPTAPRTMTRVAHKRQPAMPQNTAVTSSNGRIQLEIVSQPEQQHRARYQTEGSRGAVKDRSGNGFPIVRLAGYNKPAVLQVFIGTDIGRVAPHMFYQACKVAGKNSTLCNEKKVDGTMVIEIDFKPETDMTITCDCVGILKERNVDVEHRFPDHLAQKNKKKSTRCRMVFRTQLTHDDGTMEMLQVCSNPIICTQPPGVPEICKKSLNSCPVDGGLEIFIIGKNFLKDTHVLFEETYESGQGGDTATEINVNPHLGGPLWEQTVLPDKEYLQQTHLICVVPPYIHQNILKPVTVQLVIISSGKKSEPHTFVYTPKGSYSTLAAATTLNAALHGSLSAAQDATTFMDTSNGLVPGMAGTATGGASGSAAQLGADGSAVLWPATETKHEIDSGMMPPPVTTQMPMGVRRPSLPTATPMLTDQQLAAHLSVADTLKTELIDETSQNSMADTIQTSDAVMANCGVGGATPISPTAMQFHTHYNRESNSMETMMYDTNNMASFPVVPPTPPSVAAAVELAVKTEFAKVVAQQQQAVAVDKFITDLAKSTAVADDPTVAAVVAAAAAAADESLYGGVGGNNVGAVIDNHFGDMMQQANSQHQQQPAVLKRSLSISSNSSSHSSCSSGSSPRTGLTATLTVSPKNSLNGHNSPLTQDIILNSEPAAVLNALPMQQLLPATLGGNNATAVSPNAVVETDANVAGAATGATVNDPTGGISTEMIMNPAVSPSTILCSANGAATAVVPNIMAPHQVTMANSILNDIAMQPQPTQQDAAVAALALSNIIMSPPNAAGTVGDNVSVNPEEAATQPVTVATSTAVSNMIIKAAADLISNQEQQQQHQQQQHQHQQQQQQQQHSHQHQMQHHHLRHQQQQQTQPQSQPPVQALINGSAAVAAAAAVASNGNTSPLVNLLLNHPDVPQSAAVAAAAAAVTEVQSPFALAIPPTAPQESLIVALATENSMQKSVAAAAVTTNGAIVTQQTAGIHPGAAVGAVPIQTPFPQDLTTMSDQDLISYINPSTFDQI